MVTLNKPVAGDTDWATEINDNWTALEGLVDQTVCQGRLTLVSGNPNYNPQPKTPNATSQGGDTVSFPADHGWTTGTMVTPSATFGGLTLGTAYYINAFDADTVSFHTTLANAQAGTPKVDLTDVISAELRPLGFAGTTVYFAPYKGNRIGVYDGSTWKFYTLAEISLSLSSWTASRPSDIFVYDNSGTLTLERTEWTNDTTRATALALQNGIYVKSGSATRRYLGTIRTTATTGQCEDSVTKRFVSNYYNRRPLLLRVVERTDGWNYTTQTWRSWNNSTANRVEFISNGEDLASLTFTCRARNTGGSGCFISAAIGLDSTTAPSASCTFPGGPSWDYKNIQVTSIYSGIPSEGYHYLQMLEISEAIGTTEWSGDDGKTFILPGATGFVMG